MDPTPPTKPETDDGPIRAEAVEPAAQSAGPKKYDLRFFLDTPWVMLLTLFGVTGVLGLPALWASRGFGVWSKLVLSVVVTAYTALLVWIAWLSLHAVYVQIRDAM